MVVYKILEKFLRALHPFMPFITEEIWQRLPHQGPSIMRARLPHIQDEMIDKKVEKEVQLLSYVVTQIRNLRSSIDIKPEQRVKISVYPHTTITNKLIKDNMDLVMNLAKLENLSIMEKSGRPQATVSTIIKDIDIYLHFTGLLEISKEQGKLKEKMNEFGKIIVAKESRLKNSQFIKKAPKEVVEKEKEDIVELKKSIKRLEKMYNELL